MPLHETEIEANRIGLQALNTFRLLAGSDAAMDAIIAPLTSVGTDQTTAASYKKAAFDLAAHEDQYGAKLRIMKAAEAMRALGLYTDGTSGTIDLANTLAGMRAIHTTADPKLAAPTGDPTQQGGILFGE
jgi:hypothetical protein